MSNEIKVPIKSLKLDVNIDIKMDDKSGCFVMADMTDYKSSLLNDLVKQNNISELEMDKEELIKDIKSKVVKVVKIYKIEIKLRIPQLITSYTKQRSKISCHWKCHKYEPTPTECVTAAVGGIVSCSVTADEKAKSMLPHAWVLEI